MVTYPDKSIVEPLGFERVVYALEQYFVNRNLLKVCEIETIPDKVEDRLFANERVDKGWDKKHLKVFNSTFAKMGFRESKFDQCNLSFCTFIDCYFKKAHFEQVKFIGCIFVNCNFDQVVFAGCDFCYATFDNCFVPFAQMKNNLPKGQENLCAALCKNLSAQCLKMGEIEDYKQYLFEERAAGEIHAFRKLFHPKESYYSKYGFSEGVEGFFYFLRSKISRFMWGYGEKMSALLRSALILIVVYGIIYGTQAPFIGENAIGQIDWFYSFYLSVCSFFSAPHQFFFRTQFLQVLNLSEHIFGAVLMGFFVSALFRQINRR